MSGELPLLAALVFMGCVIDAAAGFGGTVVVVAFGALWLPVGKIVGVLVPLNTALSAYLLARGFRHVAWGFLARRMLPVMALGLGAGVALTRFASPDWLKPVFGVFVFTVAAQQLWQLKGHGDAPQLSPGSARAWLFSGGLVHGIFATGGPPIVYVASRELREKAQFRASMAAVWVVLNLMLLPRLWSEDSLVPGISAMLVAPLAAGIVVGELVHRRLDERRFRLVVSGLLLVAGLMLVVSWARTR